MCLVYGIKLQLSYIDPPSLPSSLPPSLPPSLLLRAVALALINSPRWESALRNTTEAAWGGITTPLRKLIRKMPEVAEEVFNKCTVTNATKDGKVNIRLGSLASQLYFPRVSMCVWRVDGGKEYFPSLSPAYFPYAHAHTRKIWLAHETNNWVG